MSNQVNKRISVSPCNCFQTLRLLGFIYGAQFLGSEVFKSFQVKKFISFFRILLSYTIFPKIVCLLSHPLYSFLFLF